MNLYVVYLVEDKSFKVDVLFVRAESSPEASKKALKFMVDKTGGSYWLNHVVETPNQFIIE